MNCTHRLGPVVISLLLNAMLSSCGGGANNTASATYTIGGAVASLTGSGLVLQNNGDDRAITTNGGFTFTLEQSTGSSYDVSVKTQPDNPAQTCAVTNGSGVVATTNVTNIAVACVNNGALDVAPSFTGQPSDQTVLVAATASFSANATGTPALNYQWQISSDQGTSWNDIVAATTSTYTSPSVTQNDNGSMYRVVATNSAGRTISTAATLTVLSVSYLPVSGFDITHAYEPWVTDGTPAGTMLLNDINTNNNPPRSGDSDPHNYVVFKGLTYFVARSGESLYAPDVTPYDLWSTDGTPANTQLVLTKVNSFVEFNGALYLSYDDGASAYKLYKFDEQAKTATLVPGLNSVEMPRDFYVAGNMLYFTVQQVNAPYIPEGGGANTVLWKFNGVSTQLVPGMDQKPIASSYYRVHKIIGNLGDKLVITMGADAEMQVWITDGTTSTRSLSLTDGNVRATAIFNGAIYFLATSFKAAGGSSSTVGSPTGFTTDLYKTDTTLGTTEAITRVFTGTFIGNGYSYSYGLNELQAFNGRLYFYAGNAALNNPGTSYLASSDGVNGHPIIYYQDVWGYNHGPLRVINNQLYVLTNELWRVDGASPGATQITTVCGTTDWQCNDHFFDVLLDFNGKVVFFAREEHLVNGGQEFSPVVNNLYMYDGVSTTLTLLKSDLCGAGIGSVCQSKE